MTIKQQQQQQTLKLWKLPYILSSDNIQMLYSDFFHIFFSTQNTHPNKSNVVNKQKFFHSVTVLVISPQQFKI